MRALFFLYLLFAFAVAGTADYTTQVERDSYASESGLFSNSDAHFEGDSNHGR